MGEFDNPQRERLHRLSGEETGGAYRREPGRTAAIMPARGHAGGVVGKRTLAEGWGGELPSAAVGADPLAFSRAVDAAHRQIDALRGTNAAADHYGSSEAAQQLRLALETAKHSASEDQHAVCDELAAVAAPLLAAAFAPSREAIDEALAFNGGRAHWDRDVGAWREARERAWSAVAAPFAAKLGIDAEIRVDDEPASHGARGLARAGVVHLTPALAPDGADAIHVLAHELVHVAQSRLPVAGSLADAEREADALAAGLVRGVLPHGPRIGLAADVAAADTGAAVTKAQASKPAGPDAYLAVQQTDLWRAIAAHLARVPWADPDSHAAWTARSKFVAAMMRSLEHIVDLDKPGQLDEMLFPAKATKVIQPLLPVTMETWVPAIGRAIGELFEDAILASLGRLGPRWVSIAEHEPDPDGKLDETKSPVRYAQLIKSAPIDRAVALGLTANGAIKLVGATTSASLAKTKPRERRPVTLEWQGPKDGKLWNWVKASPSDASAEEVAASLWGSARAKYGEQTSFFAYGLTVAPPLFGLPPSWARGFSEASMFAPAADGDESQSARYLALAGSWVGDGLAIDQAGGHAPSKTATAAQLLRTLSDATIQARYLMTALTPWAQADGAGVLMTWLANEQRKVATMEPAALGMWEHVLEGQKARLARIGDGVGQVVDAAKKMGLTSAAAPGAGPLVEILAIYARAAAVSHLTGLAEQLIANAAAQQARLPLLVLRATANEMTAAVDGARRIGVEDTRAELWHGAAEVEAASLAVQSKLAAGQHVDASELDEVTLRAREVRFDARTKMLIAQAEELRKAARDADKGWASYVASRLHGSFGDLKLALDTIRIDVGVIDLTWRDPVDAFDAKDTDPKDRDGRRRAVRHEQLKVGEDGVGRVRNNAELMQFLKDGASIIKWQRFATGCVNMLALLAITVTSGGVAGAVAEGVGGLMAGAGAAEGVVELSMGARLVVGGARLVTEAAVNTGGQLAVQGGDVGQTFVENLLMSGGGAVIARLAKDMGLAAELEKKTAAIWETPGLAGKAGRAGKALLKEGVAISLHTVEGAALGFAAGIIAKRKIEPQAMEVQDWFLQGASVALGRHAHDLIKARTPFHKQLELVNELHAGDLDQLDGQLLALADRAQIEPKASDAVEILELRKQVLAREVEALETLARDPALQDKAKLDRAEVALWEHDVRRAQAEVSGAGLGQIAVAASGLESLVPDRVYKGTAEQLEALETAAKRMGLELVSVRQPDGSYQVTLDGKTFAVHVAEGGKALGVKQPAPEAEPKTAEHGGIGHDPKEGQAEHVARDATRIQSDHPTLKNVAALPAEILFGAHQQAQAEQLLADMPAADYAEFATLVSSAKDPVAQGFLYKALAAHNTIADLKWFAGAISGRDPNWMIDHLTLGDPRGVGGGVKQQWSMSCNAAMTITLRGNYDPVFALRLRERNMHVGEANDHDPHAMNMNQADLEKQMLETDYQGGHPGSPKPHQGTAAPRSSQQGVGRFADDLLNAQSNATGVTFTSIPNPSGSQVVQILDQALSAHMEVPLVIGAANAPQSHYVLAQLRRVTAGHVEYSIHDPANGQMSWVRAEDIANESIPGPWHMVGTVEVPRALPSAHPATQKQPQSQVQTSGDVELGGELEAPGGSRKRVVTQTRHLYESVDPLHSPPTVTIVHKDLAQVEAELRAGKKVRLKTMIDAVDANGATLRGEMVRSYDPATQTLELVAAFFPDGLPTTISNGVGLDPEHPENGVPLSAYVQMQQLKIFGIAGGEVKRVTLKSVINVVTVAQLEIASRERGQPVESLPIEALLATHSVQYAETPLVQSGHRLKAARIVGGSRQVVGPWIDLMRQDGYGRGATSAEDLLRAHGIGRDEKLLMGFDIDTDWVTSERAR